MMGKVDKYEWVDIGSSYVPNEVSCAILWAQLDDAKEVPSILSNLLLHQDIILLNQVTAKRQKHFTEYLNELTAILKYISTSESTGGEINSQCKSSFCRSSIFFKTTLFSHIYCSACVTTTSRAIALRNQRTYLLYSFSQQL